ncbi:hypothetical protein B0A49_04160 [Cryomyces minteri]|uniref:CID domain-containing protein n=2 Tax=Cryomyces TaxID=329878 RepID=A0A4U0WQ73_9PEZI|nr:hypothetical protein B0A49_04160 [Cryomyces minteri]
MSSALPSAEVALDFKESLQDLQMNNRYEISNLTIIAKENTEHAQAISRVLENHIRTAPPPRKLPALYVLDSIVKNVGTPYTVYLGRNLYSTFMDAYTLVDGQTRKNMEGMLKTWKEPVPGSMDARPVFQPEITRAIENALIKARTAAVHQQQQARTQRQPFALPPRPVASPATPWQNTSTPPQNSSRYAPPPIPDTYQAQYGYRSQQALSQQPAAQYLPRPNSTSTYSNTAYGQVPSPGRDLDMLNDDVARLILAAKTEFAASPYEIGVQQRLKALLDLQTILKGQTLSPESLAAIKAQVAQLSVALQQPPATAAPVVHSTPQPWQPPTPVAQVYQPPPPVSQPHQPPSNLQAPISFPPDILAQLLASASNGQVSTPVPQPALPARPSITLVSESTPTPVPALANGGSSLLDSLRAAGLLPATPEPAAAAPAPAPAPSTHPILPPYLPPQSQNHLQTIGTPPVRHAGLAPPGLAEMRMKISMTSAALKIPRRHIVALLYEAQPNQCTSCGRRFLATSEGREQKARHLDWHFRINQRIADSVNRGHNRSWYVDEMEWIRSRDPDESTMDPNASNDGHNKSAPAERKGPEDQYIPVPTEAALANVNCPICQENFEAVWHDEAQEWVWMDAVKVGGRIYHATCHAEVSNAGGGLVAGRVTPDSTLGKRKAEDELNDLRARLKKDVTAY